MNTQIPNDLTAFKAAFRSESDRGCALITASFLDYSLEQLIRKKLIDDKKITDKIFGQERPLSSLSSRIDMAYLLGLIPSSAHQELHLIRKIRNDFAHSSFTATFATKSIASRCSQLKFPLFENMADHRAALLHSTFFLLGTIHHAQDVSVRIDAPDEINLGDYKTIGKAIQNYKQT